MKKYYIHEINKITVYLLLISSILMHSTSQKENKN